MGILGNVINQLTGQMVGLGFNQLDKFITRKIQEGRDEEAFAAADAWEKQAMQGIQGGGGILGGGGDFQMPALPPEIGQSPEASKYFFPRYQQIIKQDPDIVGMQREQYLDKKGTDARSAAFGRLAGQRDIGTEAIVPGVRGEMDFSAGQLQESQAQGRGLTTAAQETAKEPFRDAAFQRSLSLKQSPTYKQLHGGGGGEKEKKPKELSKSNLQNIRFLIHDAKPDLYGEDFNEKGDMVSVPTADTRWIETRAKHYMSKERLGEVSAVERAVQDFEERQNSPEVQKQKQQQRRIQAPNASKFLENAATSTPAIPETPAAPERAKEVQTGRDPATENKIRVLRQKGISAEQIKQALEEDGLNPADYGY